MVRGYTMEIMGGVEGNGGGSGGRRYRSSSVNANNVHARSRLLSRRKRAPLSLKDGTRRRRRILRRQ